MASSTGSLNISTTAPVTGNGNLSTGESVTFKALKLSLYALIFIISVVGNAVVCKVILRRRRMRTVTNCFILNLAIADLAMTCICIPFDIPVQENNYKWPYGSFICRILYPLQTMSMFASIFTLTILSLNRFRAIVYPLQRQMEIYHTKVAIISIWILSLLLSSPYMLVLGLDRMNECEETWPSVEHRKAYTASLFLLQYLLPLAVITVAYVKIAYELKKRIRQRNAANSNTALNSQQQTEARKVVRMLIVVTLLFAVCVLPNNIMWMWLDFGRGGDHPHHRDLVAVANIILFANSAANPIAYTICHENFREEFKLYFTCNSQNFHSSETLLFTKTRFKSFTETIRTHSVRAARPKNTLLVVCSKETVV